MNHRLIGLVLLLSSIARSAAAGDPSFADVLERRFSHWDRNADALLTADEVNPALDSTAVRGPEAAALTAVHLYQRRVKDAEGRRTWPPLSREFLLRPRAEQYEARRDAEIAVPNFNLWYDGFTKRLAARPDYLFAAEAPSLTGFKQGRLGDCFFLAVVGSAVHRTPDRIRAMIVPAADGSYRVTFGDGRTVALSHLADAHVLLGSTVGEQGVWLNVLEQAFAEVWAAERTRSRDDEPALDVLSRGGLSRQVMPILTGHKAVLMPFRRTPSEPPTAEAVARLTAEVAEILTTAERERRLTTTGTLTVKPLPPGIPGNHVLAVLDYHAGAATVEVWNPWCNNRDPQGEPGLKNGYVTRNGRFTMPLTDFVQTFNSITYETAESIKPAAAAAAR